MSQERKPETVVLTEAVKEQLARHGLKADGYLISWQEGSSDHPRNWTVTRRVYDTGVITFLEFFTTAISTAVTPIAPLVQADFETSHTVAISALLSMYMLGQAVGTVVLPPYSEAFGRRTLFVVSTALYAAFCVFTAAVPFFPAVFIGRFITGIVSAVPSSVVVGSVEDMWNVEDRIFLVYILQGVSIVALALGPIMGAYLVDSSLDWQWLFYIAAIVTGVVFCLCIGLRESRPSRLLRSKIMTVQMNTGCDDLYTDNADHTPGIQRFVTVSLARPVEMFFKEPLVWMVSVLNATVWALIYLLSDALPVVYSSAYFDFPAAQSSLPFLSIGIGAGFGVFVRFYDRRKAALRRKNHIPLKPEDKLLGFYIAAPTLAIGLWWFAWTIPPLVHTYWIISVLSLVLLGFSANEFVTLLAGYLIDSYTTYATSALVPCGFMRCILSAIFPLFGRQMFIDLGSNVACSVLAGMASIFCVTPYIFAKYGERIRLRSKYARNITRIEDERQVIEVTV